MTAIYAQKVFRIPSKTHPKIFPLGYPKMFSYYVISEKKLLIRFLFTLTD